MWCRSVILALSRLGKEDWKVQASLGYIACSRSVWIKRWVQFSVLKKKIRKSTHPPAGLYKQTLSINKPTNQPISLLIRLGRWLTRKELALQVWELEFRTPAPLQEPAGHCGPPVISMLMGWRQRIPGAR